jgi:Holliday junction resolvasome RuvABC ATP-dependent DNA helicase subunit
MPKTKAHAEEGGATPKFETPDGYIGPLSFAEIIGQTDAVTRLATLAALHRRSAPTVLGHILLVGLDGHGKRTIAHALARELKVNIREAEASSLARGGDLAAIIADLEEGDIFLLRGVNRIRREPLEILPASMRVFELNIIVCKGPVARTMKLAVKPFTCIGTLTSESECPYEVRDAFDSVVRLQPYQPTEILELTARAFERAGLSVEPATTRLITGLAAGNPKKAQSLIRRLALLGNKILSPTEAEEILSAYGYTAGSRDSSSIDISNLRNLSGVQFERLVAELLEKMGFRAEMTKTTGDGGIDIEAVLDKPFVGGRFLIQCKRFAPDSLVGSPMVREFYGAVTADRKAFKGILITTSGFTSQALEFASELPIELIDGVRLGEMLSLYFSQEKATKKQKPVFVSHHLCAQLPSGAPS